MLLSETRDQQLTGKATHLERKRQPLLTSQTALSGQLHACNAHGRVAHDVSKVGVVATDAVPSNIPYAVARAFGTASPGHGLDRIAQRAIASLPPRRHLCKHGRTRIT